MKTEYRQRKTTIIKQTIGCRERRLTQTARNRSRQDQWQSKGVKAQARHSTAKAGRHNPDGAGYREQPKSSSNASSQSAGLVKQANRRGWSHVEWDAGRKPSEAGDRQAGGRCEEQSDQAKKSKGRMPRHQPPMKDAASCEKPRGEANIQRSVGIRMGKPGRANLCHCMVNP